MNVAGLYFNQANTAWALEAKLFQLFDSQFTPTYIGAIYACFKGFVINKSKAVYEARRTIMLCKTLLCLIWEDPYESPIPGFFKLWVITHLE